MRWFAAAVVLGILLVTLTGCPPLYLDIENRSSQALTVYYYDDAIGVAGPGETVRTRLVVDIDRHRISAANERGELVYIQRFELGDCERVEGIYKMAIPPDIPTSGPDKVNILVRNTSMLAAHLSANGASFGEIAAGDSLTIAAPIGGGSVRLEARDSYAYLFWGGTTGVEGLSDLSEYNHIEVIWGPFIDFRLINGTDQELDVFLNSDLYRSGFDPGGNTFETLQWDGLDHLDIVALDMDGQMVFHRKFTFDVGDPPSAEVVTQLSYEVTITGEE